MEKGQAQGQAPKFRGEILLCEDNEINQHFIKNHLTRLGLEVLVAGDGREGVDAVKSRVSSGKKLFDLIFMDIQMPVMGGLEAAEAIASLGVKTPIVALTANVTAEDRQLYARHGMPRSLCKPFAAEELWACLGEYLSPVGSERISEEDKRAEAEKQRVKLFSSFVRRNQTTYADIRAALEAGDVKLAHRLAHTLRGLAGLMGKKELMESARVVEHALAGGEAGALEAQSLETMGRELSAVLEELRPYLDDSKPEAPAPGWSKDEARALLDRLEPLIRGDNAASVQFVDALRKIPETRELITQLEDYEFDAALEALLELRKTLDV